MHMIQVLLAASLAASFMEKRNDEFPSGNVVRSHMNFLQRDFRSANPEEDCWLGFVPLLDALVRHQDKVGYDLMAATEKTVLENFTKYVFAGESECSAVKADFEGRLKSLRQIARFTLVRCDANALFEIADYLSGAVRLPEDKDAERSETLKADELDRRLVFGDNIPPRLYGDVTFVSVLGRHGRECREKYRFRRLYNERLPAFRAAALAAFRKSVVEGFKDRGAEAREAIWDEFCRRAKATEAEKRAAE